MDNEFFSALSSALSQLELTIANDIIEKFGLYADILTEKSKIFNLTAITEQSEIAVKHFADSLAILSFTDIKKGAALADVGTGAGFPGVPLSIARRDLNVTFIDSTDKKLRFIKDACSTIGLNVNTQHIRAEHAGRSPLYRDKFDVVVSRAVANLSVLSEYCLPLVKPNGVFISYKGEAETELREALGAISKLSGEVQSVFEYELSDYGRKTLIVIRKISQTSPRYPRASTQISKKPL